MVIVYSSIHNWLSVLLCRIIVTRVGLTPSARLQETPNSTDSTRVNAQACSLSMQFIQGYQESSSLSIVLGEK